MRQPRIRETSSNDWEVHTPPSPDAYEPHGARRTGTRAPARPAARA